MTSTLTWRFYITFICPDDYRVLREEPSADGFDGLFQLSVTSPTRPEMPAGTVTYADLLRWQVSMVEAGHLLGPLTRISPRTKAD